MTVAESVAPTAQDTRAGAPVPLAELTGVTFRWPGHEHPVLDGIDLRLRAGSACRLRGANGAGKTTLLRLVTGVLAPTAGRIAVCGLTVEGRDRAEYQRRLSFLSSGASGLYARLTPRQHLGLWARLTFVPRAERAPRTAWALQRFGLEALADRRADRMSMGQRQRVRLAMAFLTDARVVLLDEPLTSLDDEGAAFLAAAIRDHAAAGCAVLWCSPWDDEILHADRRYVLHAGRIEPA